MRGRSSNGCGTNLEPNLARNEMLMRASAKPNALMEETMRWGAITKLLRNFDCGFVLTEAGGEVFFDAYALNRICIDEREEGQSVEFDLYDLEMGRATVARLHPKAPISVWRS